MSQQLLQDVQQNSKSLKKRIPPVAPGNTVKVHQKILENTKDGVKERIQIFEGLVIAVNNGRGTEGTFTVRKIASGVGVEKIFPLHSSKIAQIEVIRHSKIRQAKLYFMRNRTGKSARLKEAKLMGYEMPEEEEEEVSEEAIQEAVEAAKKAEEEEKKTEEGEEAAPEEAEAPPAEESKEESKDEVEDEKAETEEAPAKEETE